MNDTLTLHVSIAKESLSVNLHKTFKSHHFFMNMKNEFVLNVSYEDFLEIEICSNVGCHLLN